MNALDSPKTGNSLGEFVQHALEVRQQWLVQHDSEADQDEDLRDDWKALKPLWQGYIIRLPVFFVLSVLCCCYY